MPAIPSAPASRRRTADINGGIKSALGQYEVDNGILSQEPAGFDRAAAERQELARAIFESAKLPVDPWGNPYIYYYPGKHNPNSYDLLSAGPDGKEGTDDDIGELEVNRRNVAHP